MDAMSHMEPFEVEVRADVVDDLRRRLAATRWPDELPDAGWDYGTSRSVLRELCEHWADRYDWDGFLGRANAHPQFVTTIDGQRVHCIHARSPEPSARPLLMTHGWPGSVAEFFEVVGPLADPRAHGGDPADAFHVVCPSLPGYGFSGPTTARGWDAHRVGRAFVELMDRLGYPTFFAQGGDWGSMVTNSIAAHFPDRVAAFHLNLVTAGAPSGAEDPMVGVTEREAAALAEMPEFTAHEVGYQAIQSTKPQTLAYGLTDSPAGLAGWILEKFQRWSDCGGDVRASYSLDRLLDNISIYWITGTINSSMRLYWETLGPGRRVAIPRVTVPMGHTVYPGEIYRAPRVWVEAAFDVFYWSEQPAGGHFAAMEVPGAFVEDLRACFHARVV
jgi:microsomal epoxide hydrolase